MHCGALIPLDLAMDEVQGGGDKGGPVKCKIFLQSKPPPAPAALPPPDACSYDSDNPKIMFQSRTHNLEFQLIGEKSENLNTYVVYMQLF